MKMNNITLNGKVYGVSGWVGKIMTWLDRTGGVPTGFSALSMSVDVPAAGPKTDGLYRVKWKLKRPTIATDDSVCACDGSVLRTTFLDIVATLPAGGTAAERQEILDELDDLVADAYFRASILNLANPV